MNYSSNATSITTILALLQQLQESDHSFDEFTFDRDSSVQVDLRDNYTIKDGYGSVVCSRSVSGAISLLEELLAETEAVKVEIGNGEYTAEVTKNGIKVGCQEISFEQYDELVRAVEKIRN